MLHAKGCRYVPGWNEGIVTEDHGGWVSSLAQRQPQPEMNQMLFVETWSPNHSLGRKAGGAEMVIDRTPIVALFAPIEVVKEKPG